MSNIIMLSKKNKCQVVKSSCLVKQGFKLMMASLSISHVCTFSLYSAEGGTGRCVMPCATMPCPTLASCPLLPLLHWHVKELIASGECMQVCVCVCVWMREWFHSASFKTCYIYGKGCVCLCVSVCVRAFMCAHEHMTAPWLWICEDDKCGVVSHPGLSEHYLVSRRLSLTGHRPRQPASLGFSTYLPVANP